MGSVSSPPTDPGAALGADGLNRFLYWTVMAVVLGVLGAAGFFVFRAIHRTRWKNGPAPLAGTRRGPRHGWRHRRRW